MEKKTDQSIVKNYVFQEIVTTELVYNDSLQFLSTALFLEVQHPKSAPLFSRLQPMVSQLIQISDDLLVNLKRSMVASETSERESLKNNRTEKLKEFFNLYKEYTPLQKEYTVAVQNAPDVFKRINFYMFQNSNQQLDFGAHLIMPVQRGIRYFMLVLAIQGSTVGLDEFNQGEFSQLKLMFNECLDAANAAMPQDQSAAPKNKDSKPNTAYQFGDFTRYIFGINSEQEPTSVITPIAEPQSPTPTYQFGDIARYLIWGSASSATQPQTPVPAILVTTAVNEDEQDDDDGFTLENKKFNQ